jgi:hypothetical protein
MRRLALLTLIVALCAPLALPDVSIATYDVEMKGKSKSVDGISFAFQASGTMTLDRNTGAISFDMELPGGVQYLGTGQFAAGPKLGHGICQFEIVMGEPVPAGTAVFTGKFKKDGAKFNGKFTSVAPDMFDPTSLSYVTGKIKAVIAE